MSTYYTTARAHGGKYMKIPIEAKHVYKNTPNTVWNIIDWYGGNTNSASLYKAGYRPITQSANILYNSTGDNNDINQPWRWKQGSGAQEVIGDKIMIKSVNFHYEFTLNEKPFLYTPSADLDFEAGHNQTTQNPIIINDSATNESFQAIKNQSWRRDYRLQVIHFEQDLPTTNSGIKEFLAKWFSCTYVPQRIYNSPDWDDWGYTSMMSNKVQMLRESTPYTGKFKIIKDIQFSLSDTKPYQIIDFQLDPKKQVNLVPNEVNGIDYLEISNDWWLNTLVVLWNPMNYDIDMDPLSGQALKNIEYTSGYTNFEIGKITYSIKLTYYDV